MPIGDICGAANRKLFDHLAGALLQKEWHVEAKRHGVLRLITSSRLHRQIGWSLSDLPSLTGADPEWRRYFARR